MIEVGQTVKLDLKNGGHNSGTVNRNSPPRTGKIAEIYKHFILIQFKNYRECINKSDIISPNAWVLRVKQGKEWVQVREEMLQ